MPNVWFVWEILLTVTGYASESVSVYVLQQMCKFTKTCALSNGVQWGGERSSLSEWEREIERTNAQRNADKWCISNERK